MEMLALIFIGVLIAIIAGAISGFVALSRIRQLRTQVELLQMRSDWLASKVGTSDTEASNAQSVSRTFDVDRDVVAEADESEPEESESTSEAGVGISGSREIPVAAYQVAEESVAPTVSFGDRLFASLREHWMTWLGGGCVSLAGIFLVRYSMDQGWLGPLARILLALATGAALSLSAEALRRRAGSSAPALAALAGAGSITLYGALLAALKLYALVSPGIAFALMALVAAMTMGLALLHGPILAIFGVLGAYLVPILVSTGSGDILIALLYALLVSASALVLMRYVYRPWLWWGFFAGAMGWWLLSLGTLDADGLRTLYLTALAYLIAAAPTADWALRGQFQLEYSGYDPRRFLSALNPAQTTVLIAYLLITAAVTISIAQSTTTELPWLSGLPFFVFALWLARRRDMVFALPWLALIATIAGWVWGQAVATDEGLRWLAVPDSSVTGFLLYLLVFALTAAVGGTSWFALGRRPAVWASLATVGPILLLGLGYVLSLRPGTDLMWGVGCGVFAMSYLLLAGLAMRRESIESMVIWLFIAGHLGLGLASAIVFDAASLTLALAAQMVSLAWVIRTFKVPALSWLLKVVVLAVIVRLTLNPWLADYPTGVHWSLWTYGGSTLMAVIAMFMLRAHPRIAEWCEGAALHLLVLTIWSEVRYQLYDGAVYASRFEFPEAVTTMLLAAAMGLVYCYRATLSESLGWLYRFYSRLMAGAGLLLYGLIGLKTLGSSSWINEHVITTPFWNALLPTFGLPVLAGLVYRYWYDQKFSRLATGFSGVAAFVFVTLQVRHLWTGSVRLDTPVSDGELYSYSAVWLIIAVAAMLLGTSRFGQGVYRAGIAVLALVIAKLFLVDLAGLEGLLRVASFMGLGLSLLGIAYLHQRLSARVST